MYGDAFIWEPRKAHKEKHAHTAAGARPKRWDWNILIFFISSAPVIIQVVIPMQTYQDEQVT